MPVIHSASLPRQPQAGPRNARPLIGAAVIAAAVVAVYSNSLFGPFLFDDLEAILGNPTIRHLWRIGSVLTPPGGGLPVQARPVVNLSLAINWALGGPQAFGYHLFNLAVHLAAALTLFGVVRRTLLLPTFAGRFEASATWYGAAIALLWAVHPLATEAVTYVIQRTESLFSMFYLLTLYCCIRGCEGAAAKRWYAAAVGCCLLGMGCKEAMATAPAMVLLYDRVFVARSWKEIFRRRWGLYAGLAATWILLGFLVAQDWGRRGGTAGFGSPVTWWEYGRTQFWAISRYVRLALWPVGLTGDYGTWLARAPREIVPYAAVVAALVVLTGAAWMRRPWAGFLGTWFFVVLSPSSSVVPIATQTVAEKRMYLPLAAIVALAVFAGSAVGRRILDRAATSERQRGRCAGQWAFGIVASVALALGALTVLRNHDYRSTLAIWEDAVGKRPDNPRAYVYRGGAYGQLGEWEKEIADYHRAIELKPDYAEAYNNRGEAYAARNDRERALADYSKALELDPGHAAACNNRGALYAGMGAYDRAVEDFNKAVELRPDLAEAYSNRAEVWNRRGEYYRTIRDCEMALGLSADLAPAYYHRGNAYSALGEAERALKDYNAAIELNLHLPEIYNNRGAILARARALEIAVRDFTTAIELRPGYVEAHRNRALAYYDFGDYEKAYADVKAMEALGATPPAQLVALLTKTAPPKRKDTVTRQSLGRAL